MATGYAEFKEVHLGQVVFFILWDDDTDRAGVAQAEVVQYAADWSKVRVRVLEAPQLHVLGRTTWVLPDRLDDDARSARRNYQRRARREMREAQAAERHEAAGGPDAGGEGRPVTEVTSAAGCWQAVTLGWADVDLLVDSMDFESGWPENQARLAKYATIAIINLRPAILALLAELPGGDAVEAVRAGLEGGVVGAARALCADDPCALLARWGEVPLAEVTATADYVTGLHGALAALAEAHGLAPALAG